MPGRVAGCRLETQCVINHVIGRHEFTESRFHDRQDVLREDRILVFALAAYFGFAKALGVNIGAGVIERLLGG